MIPYLIPWFGTWRSGIRLRPGGPAGGRAPGTGPRKSILLLLHAHHCRAEYAELGSVSAGSLAGSWHPSQFQFLFSKEQGHGQSPSRNNHLQHSRFLNQRVNRTFRPFFPPPPWLRVLSASLPLTVSHRVPFPWVIKRQGGKGYHTHPEQSTRDVMKTLTRAAAPEFTNHRREGSIPIWGPSPEGRKAEAPFPSRRLRAQIADDMVWARTSGSEARSLSLGLRPHR